MTSRSLGDARDDGADFSTVVGRRIMQMSRQARHDGRGVRHDRGRIEMTKGCEGAAFRCV